MIQKKDPKFNDKGFISFQKNKTMETALVNRILS